jgi:recombinational DNA repair ATPase RecF
MNKTPFIESIAVHGYRSCKDCTFTPKQGLSALIGPNGSGKTSLLRSILLMRNLASGEGGRLVPLKLMGSSTRIKLNIDNTKITHSARLSLDVNEGNQDVIVSSREKSIFH